LARILSRLQRIENGSLSLEIQQLIVVYQGEIAPVGLYCTLLADPVTVASTYDSSLASAINAEFRELLIQELEKVDDRFFEVHDACEEEVDDLDGTVSLR